jgi:hypothetical protein
MLRIIYNGIELDVDQKSDMFLSFQANDLTELGTRGDVFNNTWELPISANNRRAFKLIENINGNRQASLTFKPCQVYVDSTLLVAGLGRVAEVRMNKYYFEVVGALRGFGQIVEALTTSDVVLGTYTGQAAGNTSLDIGILGTIVCYPIIANGITDNFNLVDNYVPAVVFPWGNLRLLAHKICEVAGYEVSDTAADDLQFATYIGGRTVYGSQDWVNGAAQWAGVETTYNNTIPFIVQNLQVSILKDSEYIFSTQQFQCINDYAWITFSVNFTVTTTTVGIPSLGFGAYIILESSVYTSRKVIDITTAYSPDPITQTITYSCNLFTNPNELLSFKIELLGSGNAITLTVKSGSTINITPIDFIAAGSNVTLRNIYGGDPKNILLEYTNRFGKLISVNEDSKKVTFSNINNLQNGAVALDWTNKIVSPEDLQIAGVYQSEFTYGTLATENTFTNANGIGSGAILSDIVTTEPSKTMFESKINGSIDSYKQVMAGLFGKIIDGFVPKTGTSWRVWKSTTTYSPGDYIIEKDSKGWFRCTITALNIDPLAANTQPITKGNRYWEPILFSELYDSFGIEDTYIAKFEFTFVPNIAPWNDFTPNISFDFFSNGIQFAYFQAYFTPVTWSTLLTTYQKPVVDALLKPRVDKFEIDLTITDVTDLDFSKPIIIDGQGYYLNLVDQFDPVNNLPTPCELVQLAQS